MLQDRLELSERRACRVGQHRCSAACRRAAAATTARTDCTPSRVATPAGDTARMGDLARGGMDREPQAGATALA